MGRTPAQRSGRQFPAVAGSPDTARWSCVFRPQLEALEDRLPPGDTLLGLSAVALWGWGFTPFDAPWAADFGRHDRGWHPGLFSHLDAPGSLFPGGRSIEAGSATINGQAVTAPITETAGGFAFPILESADVLAGQMAVPGPNSSRALLADLSVTMGGNEPAGLGDGLPFSLVALAGIEEPAGHSTELFAATGAASAALRTANLSFDVSTGQLTIRGDGREHSIRETLTAEGFVEVTFDGGHHSSNPKSADFDPSLAGAARSSLTGIRVDGASGHETLVVASQSLGHGLRVIAPGADILTQNVAAAGPLAIQAQNLTVQGAVRSGAIALAATGWVNVEPAGRLEATQGDRGGRIAVAADVFVNTGQLHADGRSGGQLVVQARNILNAGPITADGTSPGAGGGVVRLAFTDAYLDTTAAGTSAEGAPGGSVVIDGGSTGHLFSSGRHVASGSAQGGTIDLAGRDVVLAGATVDASGAAGGGAIRVGGEFQGRPPAVAAAETLTVTRASTLRADAGSGGDGGRVILGSEHQTTFDGSVSVRGGSTTGQGGLAEVSGKGSLIYAGTADARAPAGKRGTLLLDPKDLVIADAPAGIFPQYDLIDPHPTAGGLFGADVSVLSNGNVLVTNPKDNFGGPMAGAVYLFDGLTGALISSLVGSNPGDLGGESVVTPLAHGNYLVLTPNWNGNRGAVTWGSATAGVSGTISEAVSLVGVGSGPGEQVGNSGITVLSNGNYLVANPYWNGNRGAVTWGNGSTGIRGTVSEANSLVGSNPGPPPYSSNPGDLVGYAGVTLLSNGSYVVQSSDWNGGRGAVTWGNGSTGISGTVSDANSLIGSNPGDAVGSGGVTPLSNGNYVIASPIVNRNRGAVTWGNGSTGVSGTITEANSLVGSNPGDSVGGSVTPLSNGNYLVASPNVNGNRGAVTWGNGSTGISGTITEANSLVGSHPNDQVGNGVIPLSNGNYVVGSPYWNDQRGAATWGNGSTGISGIVSSANSLVGSHYGDAVGGDYECDDEGCSLVSDITRLSNGNYLVGSPNWNGARGAVTWGNGSTGTNGTVSEANSLVGSHSGDAVGNSGITLLRNGNYVVSSRYWNGNRGAVTWGNGSTGTSGIISETNSLVGDYFTDPETVGGSDSVMPLSNGNYLIRTPSWYNTRGAVTWGNGSTGVSGTISEANSLLGSNYEDYVGSEVTPLSTGNYVVASPYWNDERGAVTWGNGSTGVSGMVSYANSLIGGGPGDFVGAGVVPLSNGNYVVRNPNWNGQRGAVTWGNGSTGISGFVREANSLVGSMPGDGVGGYAVTPLSNGNYVVQYPFWNGGFPDGRGAVTWGNGNTGVSGTISEANSLVGSHPGDLVGYDVRPLSNGNYVVESANWNGDRGAATWSDGTSGQTLDGGSIITEQNSLVGRAAMAGLGILALDLAQQSFLVPFVTEGGGRITVALTDPNQFSYARGQAQTVTLTPDFLTRTLNTGTAVVLQASNDITINSPIRVSAGGQGGALTLQAGRSLILNAGISTDNGALTLIANDPLSNGVVDAQRDPGTAVITMAPGTALNTGSGTLTVALRDGFGLTNRDSGAITLQTVTAGSLSVVNNGPSAGSDVNLGPVTTSDPQSYTNPNGTTIVTGNLTTVDNPITFNYSVVVNAGVTLNAGSGVVNFAAGTVSASPGLVTVAGGVVLTDSTTFSATLNGSDPGSFFQLAASGPINLGGSTLSLAFGFEPPVGNTFEIVTNTSSVPIAGTFNGLAEGAVFSQGGYQFQITYQGGAGGNSVVVTRLA